MMDMPNSFDVRGRKLEDDELAAWLAEHSLGDRFGVTVRCADPAREPKAPVLAIVAADGEARYIDTATLTEDDEAALASWLGDPGPPKAVHDAKLVTRALARCGWALRGVTSDTAAAACLLHPEQPNSSLNELLVRHMRCALPSDHTSDTDDTEDPEEAVRALILQACAVLDLADVLDEELARIDSSSLFSELELPALRVLSEMEGSDPHDVLVAGVGYVELMTARYPAIEARVIAHLSDDAGLIGVLNAGEDPYRALASYAFPLSSDEITSQLRHRVELMFYESTASIGAEDHDLWRDLSEFLRGVIDDARRIGYCSTLLGRRRYLPDLDSDNRHAREAAERAALSLLIGGSAADIMKVAMINVHRAINDAGLTSRMVLQVDNGLVLEVAEGERETLATHLGEQLRRAYPLRAPLEVSIGYGST
jgi:DNA polymerase-1